MTISDFDPFHEPGLVDRYLSGAASVDDRARVEQWADGAAGRRALLDHMRIGLGTMAQAVPRRATRMALLTAMGSSAKEDGGDVQPSLQRPASRWTGLTLRQWVGSALVAAVLVLGIAIGRAGQFAPTRSGTTPSWFTYTTPNGQQATVQLPDGGTVLLNVASRLDVPADYASGNRTLRLQGEAVFTVQSHQRRPFTVVAGTTTARALGTRFLVRNYKTDTSVVVAVREGKVSVDSVVLVANQQLEVGNTMAPRLMSAETARFGFSTGRLILRNQRLVEAIPDLNRWYDADIRLGDQTLSARRVTGELPAGSLANLANLLELMFDVRVVRAGQVLTLYPQ